jgi:signal transduction histidine kinase
MSDADERIEPEAGMEPALEPVRTRGSLAARIVVLVLLVVIGNGASALAILDQLSSLGASFDLLTAVYIPFQDNLGRAHAQSARIGREVDRAARMAGDPEAPEFRRADVLNFRDGLQVRAEYIQAVRVPLDQALAYPDRVGGEEQLVPVRELAVRISELEALVEMDVERDPEEVLLDVPHQFEINQLFTELDRAGSEALDDQRSAASEARRQAERFTMIVSIVSAALSLLATLAVILTLRPLRRLTQSMRRLGAGDWSQRIEVGRNAQRDDEVARLAREVNLMASALEERERRLLHQERLAAVGRMASQITHEIRNPLSSVALNVELLEDEVGEAGPEARQLISRITSEVDRLTSITEDYLGFARRPKPERVRTDLAKELRELLEFMAGEHEQAGIRIEIELPDESVWVDADANQLRQAFLNLLRNAQEAVLEVSDEDLGASGEGAALGQSAATAGGEHAAEDPWIRVELRCKGGRARVVVSDSGGGIPLPKGEHKRIFEAFFTQKTHGTGLGLPMVQQIAVDHDGEVRLLSTGPQGSEFEFDLPACDPPPPSVSSETP